MAYYLSKANRSIIDLIANKIQGKDSNVVLEVGNPIKLERILRSACKLPEYEWIKDKFIIHVRTDSIWFETRQLGLDFKETEEESVIIPDKDFFEIVNILFLQDNKSITFVGSVLTKDELESIESWCDANNYSFKLEDNTIKVKKI